MARSYDIADLSTSDGEYITDNVRRKINGNFRRIVQIMQQELPSQERRQVVTTVTAIVENILDQRVPEIMDDLMDDAYPIGSVIVTATASDPRLSHGTWEQVGNGRYIRAAGDDIAVMDTGGDNEITLTVDNMPYGKDKIDGLGTGNYDIPYVQSAHVTESIEIEPEYIALLFYRRIS